jgi:hypothetical protein
VKVPSPNLHSSLGRAQGKTPWNEEEILKKQISAYELTGSVSFTTTHLAKLPVHERKVIEEAFERVVVGSLFGQRKQK